MANQAEWGGRDLDVLGLYFPSKQAPSIQDIAKEMVQRRAAAALAQPRTTAQRPKGGRMFVRGKKV